MADSTLLALLTAVSMLCAIAMTAFVYTLNKEWAQIHEYTIEALKTVLASNDALFHLFLDMEAKHDCEKRL